MEPTNETNAIISDNQTAREKFEQARLSRRAALRKMGLTTGMALFGIFAVDDLARVAIKKMEEQKQLHEVGETVAKEFKNSGIAFADATGSSIAACDYYNDPACWNSCHTLHTDDEDCTKSYAGCLQQGYPTADCQHANDLCAQGASDRFAKRSSGCSCTCTGSTAMN